MELPKSKTIPIQLNEKAKPRLSNYLITDKENKSRAIINPRIENSNKNEIPNLMGSKMDNDLIIYENGNNNDESSLLELQKDLDGIIFASEMENTILEKFEKKIQDKINFAQNMKEFYKNHLKIATKFKSCCLKSKKSYFYIDEFVEASFEVRATENPFKKIGIIVIKNVSEHELINVECYLKKDSSYFFIFLVFIF